MVPDHYEPEPRRCILALRAAGTAIEVFAASEEEAARILEQVAGGRPELRDERQRAADDARSTARRAREIVHSFTDEPTSR